MQLVYYVFSNEKVGRAIMWRCGFVRAVTQFLASPVPRSALSLQQTETRPGGLSHVGHGLTGSAHRFLIHVCLLLAGDDGGVLVLPCAGPPRRPPLLSVELQQLLSCPAVTAAQLPSSPLTTITSARAPNESENGNTHTSEIIPVMLFHRPDQHRH